MANRVVNSILLISILFNIILIFSLIRNKGSISSADIEKLNSDLKNKEALIHILKKQRDINRTLLLNEINNPKYIKSIIIKYEKINDTIYSNPIKRDSITLSRLKYWKENRDRFSYEGFINSK